MVSYNTTYIHKCIDQQLSAFGLTADGKPLSSHDVVDIIEGYQGLGYGVNTDEELGK